MDGDWYLRGCRREDPARLRTREDAERLTHINLAFGVIREGLLEMSHLPHIGEVERIRKLNPKLSTNLN